MADVFSVEQTANNGPAVANLNGPQINPWNGQLVDSKTRANTGGQDVRTLERTYIVPASPPAVGDRIVWGKLPRRARPLGNAGVLSWSIGAASSTLTVGDGVNSARHLAATLVATSGAAIPQAARAGGAQFETSDDGSNLRQVPGAPTTLVLPTDDCTLVSLVGGAALQPGQIITLVMPFVTV